MSPNSGGASGNAAATSTGGAATGGALTGGSTTGNAGGNGGGGSSSTGLSGGAGSVNANAGGATNTAGTAGSGGEGGSTSVPMGGSGGVTAAGAGGQSASGGSVGAAGQASQGGSTGVFTQCDDHADFNGRGRCPATGNVGAVFATQVLSATGVDTSLTAIFGSTNPPTDAACTVQQAGASCSVLSCPRNAATNPGGPSAGVVSAVADGASLMLAPSASGAYDTVHKAQRMWLMPKAGLTLSTAGADVSAVSEMFCGPPSLTLTAPAQAPGTTLSINRTSDLALLWSGSTVGQLEFVVYDETSAPSPIVEVRCFFDASANQGTVPMTALGQVSAGMHTVGSYLWVRKIGIGADGVCVELTGITTNLSAASNAPFNGAAMFQ
ncbi:MAG TPA: hypothetical protein VL137_16455 [Polyangiaceae bacterium]|nr:hypothetical protein [Polyangiaceae bacterium]